MKITKNGLVALLAVVLSLGPSALVLADNNRDSEDDGRDSTSTISSTSTRIENERDDEHSTSSTSSKERDNEEKDLEDDHGTSTATSSRSDRSEGDEHRSDVATFVQNLLKLADRIGGIGQQVRDVAHQIASSSASTTEAISKVEDRNVIKTFLFGSDFKSLGMLRKELARTEKLIERLNMLASSTTSSTTQAALAAQIKLLQDDQAKVQAFVQANESKFSLFGWFVKIFNRED